MTSVERQGRDRALTSDEKRAVAVLGVPTLALALAVTVVTTYLPVVARGFVGSDVVVGLIVGLEGLVALWLPLVVGTWSDRLHTRIGGRLPFLVSATPLIVAALVGMAFVSSTLALGAVALAFFLGYFLAYEPYRALYPDVLGDEVAGRAQGTQALWRGAGAGLALLGGGLLLSVWSGAPFIGAAVALAVAIAVFCVLVLRRGVPDEPTGGESVGAAVRRVGRLIRSERALQSFLVANALWELSLSALKTFVVLYVTTGLGYSRVTASLMIGGVAVIVLAAALMSGKFADRYGRMRVLSIALPVYGLGFLVPFVFTSPVVIAAAIPLIAIGGGTLMALPYALLIPLMPDGEHGAVTGYYSVSRGLGAGLGPLLAGVAITVLRGPFATTDGYQAVWGVCAAAALLSLLPLRSLRRAA